ncbi:MAG: HDOD domain-containing protein [Caldilineaceae bacterium]|nr:HDOD domain-containing protein [Caldilineaceae bacterium]
MKPVQDRAAPSAKARPPKIEGENGAVFVARQPIFDRGQHVYGYELLFRQGVGHVLDSRGDSATSSVLTNSFSLIGMETLTSGKRAFINFTRNLLLRQVATTLPADMVAVEILEDVEPDPLTLEACRKLKERGYMLVLDDFVYTPRLAPLVRMADIIKIDFLNTSIEDRERLPRELGNPEVKYLAEKVETKEDFQMALDFGYHYIQGYFFSKPETISVHDIPGYKLNYLYTLYEINQPQINFDSLEAVILREVSLSYKLLRFINSAFFNLRHRIKTVRHALMLLGTEEIRKWASLVALSGMGADKPDELAVLSAMRGRFFELLAMECGFERNRTDLYMMGLFSLVDAFTDVPMEDVLKKLPLNDDVKRALGHEGGRYEPIYQLALAYEEANWERVSELSSILQNGEAVVPRLYQEAVAWANQIFYNEDNVD